ncbi:MAG: response regulator [Gammaproteobacteria bacterium]
MNAKRIGLLLVDDHTIVRQGFRTLLEKQPDLKVIAEAGDGAEAYRRFQETAPDVVIIDITMPGLGGIETIARLKQRDPRAAILVFTMHQNPLFALQATRAGAKGYVTKSSPPEVLLRAIYDVYQGRHALSPDIAHALALRKLHDQEFELQRLSPREFEIFRMLAEAQASDAIAATLHLSPKTVANCHYEIKRKLGVKSDIELVRLALQYKVVDLLDIAAPAENEGY